MHLRRADDDLKMVRLGLKDLFEISSKMVRLGLKDLFEISNSHFSLS